MQHRRCHKPQQGCIDTIDCLIHASQHLSSCVLLVACLFGDFCVRMSLLRIQVYFVCSSVACSCIHLTALLACRG